MLSIQENKNNIKNKKKLFIFSIQQHLNKYNELVYAKSSTKAFQSASRVKVEIIQL